MESGKHQTSRTTPEWVPVSLILLLVAVIRSVQSFFFLFEGEQTTINYFKVLANNLVYFLYFVPLSILARLWTHRFPFRTTKLLTLLSIHVVTVLLSFFLHQTLMITLEQLLWNAPWHSSLLFYRFFNNPAIWIEFIVYSLFVLGFYLHDYQIHIRTREVEAARLEAELMNARVQELKNRLQPRFLLSTLSSIATFVRNGKFSQANSLLSILSDYLRVTVYSSIHEWVTLDEEIDFLRLYLEIESIRMNRPMTVRENRESLQQEILLPKFTLQPLVENILEVCPRSRHLSYVTVSTSSYDSTLQVALAFPTHIQLRGKSALLLDETLKVLEKRLTTLYNAPAHILLQHEKNTTTTVLLKLPVMNVVNSKQQ